MSTDRINEAYQLGREDERAGLSSMPPEVKEKCVTIDVETTTGELAARFGAFESPEGFVCFGSWMAVNAMRISIENAAYARGIKDCMKDWADHMARMAHAVEKS